MARANPKMRQSTTKLMKSTPPSMMRSLICWRAPVTSTVSSAGAAGASSAIGAIGAIGASAESIMAESAMALSGTMTIMESPDWKMVSPSWAETGAANKRATAKRANNCFMVKVWVVVVSLCRSRWGSRGANLVKATRPSIILLRATRRGRIHQSVPMRPAR